MSLNKYKLTTKMILLGQKAKDKITGFSGILVGRCQYITGCDQYGIAPPAKAGKTESTQWFDEGRIEITGKGVKIKDVLVKDNGGPSRDCPQ
jgi:hypothetical protein